jgi:NitT/TauT family transport system permease protein
MPTIKTLFQSHRRIILPGLVFALILVMWAGLVDFFEVTALLLPGPIEVILVTIDEARSLRNAAWSTFSEIVLAAVLAIAGGFLTAALLSLVPFVRRAIFPYILMTQVVPKVAIAPILIVWFGTGMTSRLILAFLIAYFPMVVNTLTGLLSVGQPMLRYAQSLTASEWQVFTKVRLPVALPMILSGVKITMTVAVIGIVVGEFVAADEGLAKIIIESSARLETALTVSATLLVALIGLVLLGLVEVVERRLVFWRSK